jgi:acetyl-CoA synthetase
VTTQAEGSQPTAIENLLHEARSFPPPARFAAAANARSSLYDEARAEGEAFWARQARTLISWHREPEQILDWSDAPTEPNGMEHVCLADPVTER